MLYLRQAIRYREIEFSKIISIECESNSKSIAPFKNGICTITFVNEKDELESFLFRINIDNKELNELTGLILPLLEQKKKELNGNF